MLTADQSLLTEYPSNVDAVQKIISDSYTALGAN
jgi:hypothetical protein